MADTLTGSIRTQAHKKFGEKRAWAHPETAQIFRVPPIIFGTGKATNFKFGRCIHSVHANKSPLKIWEKRERGHKQGLAKFFHCPLVQTSNFVRTFLVLMGTKAIINFGKSSRALVRTLKIFQGTDILSASRGRLCDSSAFCSTPNHVYKYSFSRISY